MKTLALRVLWLCVATLGYASAEPAPNEALREQLQRLSTSRICSGFVSTPHVNLHVVTAGDPAGKPLMLLHGFPEFWWAWHEQIAPLVERGYFLIIPDLRGFNHSGKPQDFNEYRRPELVADVRAVLQAFGLSRAIIVGHDIGGGVVWWLASEHPENIGVGVIFNASHPKALLEDAQRNPQDTSQAFRAFLAQRALSEMFIQTDNFEPLLSTFREANARVPGAFSPGEIELYRTAWRQAGATRAMMGHYQAVQTYGFELPERTSKIAVPIRLVWGAKDKTNLLRQAELSLKYLEEPELIVEQRAGHWILHEAPQFATQSILEFIGRHDAVTTRPATPPFRCTGSERGRIRPPTVSD